MQEVSQNRDCIKVHNDIFTTVYIIDTWLLLCLWIYQQHLISKRFLPTHKYVLESHSQTVSLLLFFHFISKFMRSECRLSKYVYDRRLPVSRLVSAVGDSIFYWQIQHLWHNNSYVFNLVKAWGLLKTTRILKKKEQLPTNYPSQKNVKIK